MICEIGKADYPLPADFFDVYDHPHLETEPREQFPNGYTIMLLRLAPAEMDRLLKEQIRKTAEYSTGRPHYYALMPRERFVVHPPPDKPYVIHVRYFAQPKVW